MISLLHDSRNDLVRSAHSDPLCQGHVRTNQKSNEELWGTVFCKPTNTLWQPLVRLKDKAVKEMVIYPVYKVKCEDYKVSNVGETGRTPKARFQEH